MSARGPPVPVTAPPPGKGDAKAGKGVAFRSLPREQMEDVLMNAGVDLDGAHIRSVLDGVTMPLTAARSASGRGPMILVDTQNDNLLFRVSLVRSVRRARSRTLSQECTVWKRVRRVLAKACRLP